MATVEKEQSVPQTIRTKSEQSRQYRDHARQLRKDYDRDAAAREAAHQKLIDAGTGPVDSSEVLKLQQSRWNIFQQNETALRKLVGELQEIKVHLDDEYRLCGQMVDQYRDAEVQRLVDDFGHREGDAKTKIDFSEPLAEVKRSTHKIHDASQDVLKMIQAAGNDLDAITATRARLSRTWRTF